MTATIKSAQRSADGTDAEGVIQIFNVGAERMFGYSANEVVDKITAVQLHKEEELAERAAALSLEYGTPIAPGFEAVVYRAARGIEDTYAVTKVRKDGSTFPATVTATIASELAPA